MTSVFSPVPADARREQRAEYRSFLAARDGAVDLERRTLSRREETMQRYLAPSTAPRPVDQALFDEQYARYDARREMSREMLLLLALVKINAAEAYGVRRMIEPLMARIRRESDDLEMILTIEEDYHTKILLSTSSLYGLSVTAPYRPQVGLRALIGLTANLPHTMSRPLVLVAELIGTLYFLDLLRVVGEVLSDLPAVRDAVEERLFDVITDEVGHVSYNRLCLGSVGLAQARMLCPAVAMGLAGAVPELRTLGLRLGAHVDRPLSLRSELPDQVRRQAFFA